jgi:ribosomal protein L37AE/L43A
MKKFQRTIEDFTCEHCGNQIKGTGYTNHCPKCLYSKHVDINPGDRANSCQGLMKPINLEMDHGEYVIIHQCQKCGESKRNKANKDDDFDALIKLSKTLA